MNRVEKYFREPYTQIPPEDHILDQFQLYLPTVPSENVQPLVEAAVYHALRLQTPDPRVFPLEHYIPKRFFSYWLISVRDLLLGAMMRNKGDYFIYPPDLIPLLDQCLDPEPETYTELVPAVFGLGKPFSARFKIMRAVYPDADPSTIVQSIIPQLSQGYENWFLYAIIGSLNTMRNDGYSRVQHPYAWYILYSDWKKRGDTIEFQKNHMQEIWNITKGRIKRLQTKHRSQTG